jgi:hypothetical protein
MSKTGEILNIIDDLIKGEESKPSSKYTDEELKEVYGLTPEEIDKVQHEGYDPWDFEEEDESNEDDYYSEDN